MKIINNATIILVTAFFTNSLFIQNLSIAGDSMCGKNNSTKRSTKNKAKKKAIANIPKSALIIVFPIFFIFFFVKKGAITAPYIIIL